MKKYKYVAQSLIGSSVILSINPLSYYKKYIKNKKTPLIYNKFSYFEFEHEMKYKTLDNLCPFIFESSKIIQISLLKLTKKQLSLILFHRKIRDNCKKIPWWKNV